MIELKSVEKIYHRVPALLPTNLEIPRGQTTVLLGTSGCGKSTILRIIIGLIAPDRGQVFFDGKPLDRTHLREARFRMGYVIQDGGLFPHLTARQNVSLAAEYLGWPKARIDERITELAALTKLGAELLSRYPVQLSGGQMQRVGLMRALMLDPDVLLLDEPLAALDPIVRSELQADLKAIATSLQKTVLLVTHDLAEAVYFADTLVLMRHGTIVQRGTFADLTERPSDPFVTKFINAQRQPW